MNRLTLALLAASFGSQLFAQHTIHIDANYDVSNTFAPVHGVNGSPYYHGETAFPTLSNPHDTPKLAGSWSAEEPTKGVYNRSWAADYAAHFAALKIPQSRCPEAPMDINTIWKKKLFTQSSSNFERDFDCINSEQSTFSNFEFTGFQEYLEALSDLPDTEVVWRLGNAKAVFKGTGYIDDNAIGFNRVPNHGAYFAEICSNVLRHFNENNTIYSWPDAWPLSTVGKGISLVEVWNEPYFNKAWSGWYNPPTTNPYVDEPFWNGSPTDYADLFHRVQIRLHDTLDGADPDALADDITIMASLIFGNSILTPGVTQQQLSSSFTGQFLTSMENRHDANEPWKTEIRGLSAHWYLQSPADFVNRFRNIDLAFIDGGLNGGARVFTDTGSTTDPVFPEVWITEWNQDYQLLGNENYADTAGEMPYLMNSLFYLDGLYHGDFLPNPNPMPGSGRLIDDYYPPEDNQFHISLGGAQVFSSETNFWTREGIGPFNSASGSVNKAAGVAWEVYGKKLFQEAKYRLSVLDGILENRIQINHNGQTKSIVDNNLTVMAGRGDGSDGTFDEIVIVVSSINLTANDLQPSKNFDGQDFSHTVTIDNFPYGSNFSIKREAYWTPNAPIDYPSGGEASLTEVVTQPFGYITQNIGNQTMVFSVDDMRKNSYEVYTITPSP